MCELLLMNKYINLREVKNNHAAMVLITIVIGVLSMDFAANWKIIEGQGDQFIYLDLAKNLNLMINDGRLSDYYAKRILPSLLVSSSLDLLGCQISDVNIIRGFYIYNMILIIGSGIIWKKIADSFSFSIAGRWFGFAGLFMSYQATTQTWFIPVMTDVTALFVGMLLLFFYLKKNSLGICVVAIVGSFSWQIVGLSGVILLIFLRQTMLLNVMEPVPNTIATNNKFLSRMWSIGIFITVMSLISLLLLNIIEFELRKYIPHYLGFRSLITGLPSLVAVAIGLIILMNSFSNIRGMILSVLNVEIKLIVLAFMVIAIPQLIILQISNFNLPYVSGISSIIKVIVTPPDGKIFLPFVTLLVFWGPTVVFLLLNWYKFSVEARKLGGGFTGIIALGLPLCLATEPRFITSVWPFFVLGSVIVFEKSKHNPIFFKRFMICSLLLAQFWLLINPFNAGEFINKNFLEIRQEFFRNHYGLWMSWDGYWLNLLFTLICLFWMKKQFSTTSSANEILHRE